ncbi:ATP-dependent DNA helicase RecQ [Paraflavisolibacter sp. H34]|uniref:RecQ family ATP-dependent DNA helicase n=1 Tax=Huijunlia imazamoxiresistens TaxID=3127457 RepID=UPI003016E31A
MSDIHDILKQYWGYSDFRPLQQEIIESVLSGKDTLALLPTGGGKSLCFQVPAMAREGICLVVSPLIALMKDQVESLKKRGILAAAIDSGMSRRQIAQTLKNAAFGPYKFLYVSPERIETALFQEFLPALTINLVAVDEAHCISQWGYDFRPSYLRIAELREHLPGVPVLALTASATAEVQQDICDKLLFDKGRVLRQSFERPNLSYSIFTVEARMNKMVEIFQKVPGTGIVYCRSRKRTGEIARLLQLHGISAHAYHAGLSAEERATRQQDWIDSKVRVMACTNAFGMGIDKPDVRVVVHVDVPDCLENYYQEAGRAGRDGRKSYAVLLHDEKDLDDLAALHIKRFPSFAEIRQVYHALVNFLQIPVYSGEDQRYSFRFETFIKNFSLDPQVALYSLKALESDGWLDFNEKSFRPSTLGFTTNKRGLYAFEADYPAYEPLLTTLLRTYEGIFDFPVYISEVLVAKLLRTSADAVKKMLAEVAAHRMVKYTPQSDEPQIIFRKSRVAADDLRMDLSLYHKRKEAFIRRVQKMIAYTRDESCRSRFINSYFGDEGGAACGICDNCLRAKAPSLSPEEVERITVLITRNLSASALTAAELLEKLQGIQHEKTKKVLRFLQTEERIRVNGSGKIELAP